jgi:lipopolysaccharide export system permease protein
VKIIESTLIREILMTLLVVMLVLSLIVFSSQLARMLALAASGKIPADVVFAVLGLKLPAYIILLMPLGMLLAVLLSLGRMAQDNELVILLASGMGLNQIGVTVAKLAIPLTGLLLLMSLVLAPAACYKSSEIQQQQGSDALLAGITPGQFTTLPGGNRVIYVGAQQGERLEDIFIYLQEREHVHILRAPSGEFGSVDGYTILKLYNGQRYSGKPGSVDYTIIDYKTHGITLAPETSAKYQPKIDEQSTTLLWQQREHPKAQAELQWRLAIPIMGFVLMITGVVLTSYKPRSGKFGSILPGVVLYFIYINLASISQQRIEDGEWGSIPGIWWVHGLMFAVLAGLIYRNARKLS